MNGNEGVIITRSSKLCPCGFYAAQHTRSNWAQLLESNFDNIILGSASTFIPASPTFIQGINQIFAPARAVASALTLASPTMNGSRQPQ